MTVVPLDRPAAREAGNELLVLQRWEETTQWLLEHTHRWPKSCRFTLTQRVQNLALDILEKIVVARYQPKTRDRNLQDANLMLERLRFLLRTAHATQVMPPKGFERAMGEVDEVGRMLHGWRTSFRAARARP